MVLGDWGKTEPCPGAGLAVTGRPIPCKGGWLWRTALAGQLLVQLGHDHPTILPPCAVRVPRQVRIEFRDAAIVMHHGTIGLRPLAQTPAKGTSSRNFLHYSIIDRPNYFAA